MRLMFILLLVTSCGKSLSDLIEQDHNKDPRKTLSTDIEFNKYIDIFKDDYYIHHKVEIDINNIPINFTDTLEDNIAGVCFRHKVNGEILAEIQIDRTYWNNYSESSKIVLIKHELGHCYLNIMTHNNNEHKGYYTSIMNKYLLSGHIYDLFSFGYNSELYLNDDEIIKKAIDTNKNM